MNTANFASWVNWASLEGTMHTLIAAFVGGVMGAIEQWVETGQAIPSTPAGWHHFIGVVIAAGVSAALLLWKSPPATAGTAVQAVEAAVPAAQQIKAIEPLADSIAAAAPMAAKIANLGAPPKPPGS